MFHRFYQELLGIQGLVVVSLHSKWNSELLMARRAELLTRNYLHHHFVDFFKCISGEFFTVWKVPRHKKGFKLLSMQKLYFFSHWVNFPIRIDGNVGLYQLLRNLYEICHLCVQYLLRFKSKLSPPILACLHLSPFQRQLLEVKSKLLKNMMCTCWPHECTWLAHLGRTEK